MATPKPDADSLTADLFSLGDEEQTRFLLILLKQLDSSDTALLQIYQKALDEAGADASDKEAFYKAIDSAQDAESPKEDPESVSPGDVFDFDLFDERVIGDSPLSNERRKFLSSSRARFDSGK